MDIVFYNSKFKKVCENHKKLRQQYGPRQADEIVVRIDQLKAAETLNDISKLPQARLHSLSGKFRGRKNCRAVDLKHPYRLILYPLNGKLADYTTITKIELVNIEDYH